MTDERKCLNCEEDLIDVHLLKKYCNITCRARASYKRVKQDPKRHAKLLETQRKENVKYLTKLRADPIRYEKWKQQNRINAKKYINTPCVKRHIIGVTIKTGFKSYRDRLIKRFKNRKFAVKTSAPKLKYVPPTYTEHDINQMFNDTLEKMKPNEIPEKIKGLMQRWVGREEKKFEEKQRRMKFLAKSEEFEKMEVEE